MSPSVHIVRELFPSELPEAARLLGRSMCDNPVNVRAFGIQDTERLSRTLARFFVPVLRGLSNRGELIGALRNGTLAGVCGLAPPGRCQPSVREKLSVFPSVIFGNPPAATLRVLKWTGEWARRDPAEPHWHLGPVAVAPDLQGQGIGSSMLAAFCDRMDACDGMSYLETDKPENVALYQKFGFMVVADANVLGVQNWFMTRQARVPANEPHSTGV